MEIEITFKNGRIHVYSCQDFCLDVDHNILELYSWYFLTHAKNFKLSSISKIVKFYFHNGCIEDREIVYELH